MGFTTLTLGLTLKVPEKGQKNWAEEFLNEFAIPLSSHDHTGSGMGKQLTGNSFADDTIDDTKIYARNINYYRGRNFAGDGFVDLIGANASDEVHIPSTSDFTELAKFTNIQVDGGVINSLTSPVAITEGGTGATDAATARSNLGIAQTVLDLSNHIADTSNPHSVTAAQVGSPTQAEFDALESLYTAHAADPSAHGTFLLASNNLSDIPSDTTARTNIGAAALGDNSDITRLFSCRDIVGNPSFNLGVRGDAGRTLNLGSNDLYQWQCDTNGDFLPVTGANTFGNIGSEAAGVGVITAQNFQVHSTWINSYDTDTFSWSSRNSLNPAAATASDCAEAILTMWSYFISIGLMEEA